MHIPHMLSRVLISFLGVVALVVYVAWKWKRASDTSDAIAAERKAARESFELLKQDPRFLNMWQYIASRYRATFDRTPDSATYCIRYIGLLDGTYQRLFAQNGPGARYLVAYLERGDEPARLQVTLDLQTGTCGEVALGWLAWQGSIPAMS